ncbi:S-layer homology domain-containing protein [Mitsuokella jalaludinii]|uniref:S-layer homology domain-containing protein n=2 Tax=Mitsuokella jalaludinii TaxID=187979 RepID=UPI003C6D09BE
MRSVALGDQTKAIGESSTAIGVEAEATALDSIAIGGKTKATSSDSIAIGNDTTANSQYSVAIGDDIHSTGKSATAVGQQAHATGDYSTALGAMTNVDADWNKQHPGEWRKSGKMSTAIGYGSGSWGDYSTAIGGEYAKAEGQFATAIGSASQATAENTVALGGAATAEGRFATAIGTSSQATAENAVALGGAATANVYGGVALGTSSVANRAAEAGVVGAFAPEGADGLTWKANAGAVSVGSDDTITRQITNVAAGSEATDAVNVAQLTAATENAGWNLSTGKEITNPTKVKSGATVDFSGDGENITVSKEETDYATLVNVKLNKNLNVDSVQAGDFFMNNKKGIGFGGNAYITKDGLNANDKVITNVAKGKYNTDAVNVGQLKKVEEVAANANKGWNLSTNGVATEVTNVKPGDFVDFSGDKNISVSHDGTKVKVELNKDIDVNSVQTNALNSKYNLSVGTANVNGTMPFFVNSNGAFYAANGKLVVDKDGKLVAPEAELGKVTADEGEIGNVVLKNGVYTGNSALRDGELFVGDASGNYSQITPKSAKLGKVTIDKDGKISGVAAGINDNDAVNVGQLKAVGATANMGWNLATNGVATEATNVKPGDVVDFSGDKNISVSHDGTKVKVELNKDIDVNSVQTNALNSKYNLSVGTMAENGIMPFFVNSTGDFYAAHNKFHVDKDGKVTATEGEIGNVVLKNGVLYKNTALRDGELYVGDADGNYSQITPKSAKLGQVTIDEKGNMAGVNSIQTNALNAKYNLSVGTANENGTVPFFVNSNGAFYAANGKLVVDKDGKVTATEGEIGNVVLKNGVLYKNTALRDGELYVGDASGNYSQITTKGAKLGKVTVAADGKISGVAAGAVTADSTDAVNGSQLHAVATEAGKHSKVVNGSNINVEETDLDGQKVYKVNLNKDIMLGDLTGKNVSISGTNGTIEATGAIATKDRVYADKGAKLADIDVTGDTISNGDAKLALNGAAGTAGMINGKGASVYMQDGYTVINSKVAFDQNGKISGVAAGAVTADSTDAVNGSQLHAVATEAGKHSKVVNGSNINVEETDLDGQKVYKVNLNKDIMLGDLTGKNVSISGTNGTIEATGAIATNDRVHADKGAKLADIDVAGNKISNGASSIVLDGSNVKVNDKVTIDQDGKISGVAAGEVSKTSTDAINGSQLNQTNENVAALDKRVTQNEEDIAQNKADIAQNKADIAQNKADIAQNKTDIKNLDNRVTNVEELAKKHTTVTAGDNIAVTESTNKDGGKEYKVALDKDINLDSVTTGQTVMNNDGLKVGKDVSVTATAVTAGKTSISDEGVKVGDKTYISDKGLNANDQKVTNVAAGELSATSKDAVNGSQLYETKQAIANNATNISSLSHSISNLDNRVNKVGAGAAALAALHPLDFDPDAKWDFAAGYGNYRGANAAAVGAYYRPNEDTMFSVGGTFGNGENMVNAGVSFKLGSGSSHVSTSRVAMAKEIKELRGELEAMKSAMLDANAGKKIDTSKLQLFPDVPQNHWAYEYVAQLAGNGMIEGYPDGNFAGDRPMTRYEFAAILYRAMAKGAVLSDKILSEFSHELEYFTVDTIAKDKAGNPTIQRVRTVKENKNK